MKRPLSVVALVAVTISLSPIFLATSFSQEPSSAAEDDELSTYVENVRNLLGEAKEEYNNGNTDKALNLATRAYINNYEYLEAEVDMEDEELNEEVETMMRHELLDMIRNEAPAEEVSKKIDTILSRMDQVAMIVPEFGPLAVITLAVAIMSIVIVVGTKGKALSFFGPSSGLSR